MPLLRFYTAVLFTLSILFTGLNVAARALGSTQPSNPALRGFTEGCEGRPRACWYGIVPGVTQLFEVKRWADENGFREVDSWIWTDGGGRSEVCRAYDTQPTTHICLAIPRYVVERIIISADTVDLNDFISTLGLPSKIGQAEYGAQTISFGAAVEARVFTLDWWRFSNLSPQLPVGDWMIYTENRNLYGFHWHGFKSRWRYCELEPVETICP